MWVHALVLRCRGSEESLSSGERFWAWNPKARRLVTDQGTFEAKDLNRYASLAQIETKRWRLDTDVPAPVCEPPSNHGVVSSASGLPLGGLPLSLGRRPSAPDNTVTERVCLGKLATGHHQPPQRQHCVA